MTHIQTPQRVRVTLDEVVYVSSDVAREIRPMTMRIGSNILVPRRNQGDQLREALKALCKKQPEHFMAGSRAILQQL